MAHRVLYTVGLLVLVGGVQAACTARGSTPSDTGVNLRLGFVGPNLPGVGVPAVVSLLSSSSQLFRDPSTRTPSSAIIDRVDVSDNGLVYTFRLRPNIVAHDGTPVTSAALEPVFSSLSQEPLAFPHRHIVGVSSPSSQVVEVRLSRPSPLFLESLVDFAPPVNGSPAGAFVPLSSDAQSVTFRSFEGFAPGRPTVESLEIKVFPTWRTAWGAMLRGEVDGLWEAPTDAVDFIEAASEFRIYGTVRRYAYLLGFNLRDTRLRDVRVRQAFAHAVDRSRFVKVALRGHGETTATQLNPSHWSAQTPFEALPFDRQRARALLTAFVGGAPSRSSEADTALSLECLVPADDRFERVAQELRRQLATVGVELRLVPLPLRALVDRIAKGAFESYLLEAAGQSPLLLERFWASFDEPFFNSGYVAADAAFSALREASTEADVRAAVARVQQVMRDDPPAVFLAYPTVARVLHRRFLVPPIPEESSLVSQRVLPFVRLAPNAGVPAP
jgi:peptide/nickel transport system substrate-binding protein